MVSGTAKCSEESAEVMALHALGFLAGEPKRLETFLSLTGLDLDTLRNGAGTRPVQTVVLGHLLQNESLLLVFSAECGLAPADIGPSFVALGGALNT